MFKHRRWLIAVGLAAAALTYAWTNNPAQQVSAEDRKLQQEVFKQLDSLYEAKGEAVEKLMPELMAKLTELLKGEPNAARLQIGTLSSLLLEMKGQYAEALKLHAMLNERFSKSKEFSEAAAKGYDAAKKRHGFIGKQLKLEGTLVGGEKLNWDKYKGKVVLVDFWATWCGPCRAELPNVKKEYKEHHEDGFEVLGISLDEDAESLKRFLSEDPLPWETVFGEDAKQRGFEHPMAKMHGVVFLPVTMLVGRDGKVARLNVRGEDLGAVLPELLKQKPKKTADVSGE